MTYPSRNSDIALQLLEQFSGLIDGISYKMGVRYRLSQEDREDLVSAAKVKLTTIKWRTLLRRGKGKNLNNYAISVIQTMMAKELRRIKAEGLSGLSKGPTLGMFPQHDDNPQPEQSADGLPDRLAALELAGRAKELLSEREWQVVSLLHGFDGGPSRTPQQVARELDLSSAKVETTLEVAMQKLRRSLSR